MSLPFSIAGRFLKANKTQTLVIALGIAVGVSVQVFIGSLITGLQKSLIDKTIGASSQITVQAPEGVYISDYLSYESELTAVSGVTHVSPTILTAGTAIAGAETTPILARGVTFEKADLIYGFSDKLTTGNLPASNQEILLGQSFHDEGLMLQVGDLVTFAVPLVGNADFTVSGFMDFKVAALNQSWAFIPLAGMQSLLGIGDAVSSIEMQLTSSHLFDAQTIAGQVSALFGDGYTVSDWMSNNQELLSGLKGQSISSVMIQVFVLVSVVLGIASVLAITVMQKSKQIGILKAMGLSDGDAALVFLSEGLMLGILGALLGVLLGLGLSVMFTTFAVGADGLPILALYIDPGFIALSAGIAILASGVASLIPAAKSRSLSVIEVIRNG